MAKNSDVNALVRMFEMGKTFGKQPEKKTRTRKTVDLDDVDPAEVLMKLVKRKSNLEDSIKAIEKLTFKEEKKPERTKYSTVQVMMLMLGTAPITGAIYLALMHTILNAIK